MLLLSSYELGHQPMGLASPLGFLERAGFAPAAIDLAVEPLDPERLARAAFVGLSVPMHTATRIALAAARAVREQNPAAHICFYGLYAPLSRELLRQPVGGRPLADSLLGGECEQALVDLVVDLAERRSGEDASPPSPPAHLPPIVPLSRLRFAAPSRRLLPPLDKYARLLGLDGGERLAGYSEASRGCKHTCRHCPIPAVYGGRFFAVPVEVVVEDARRQAAAGATHLTLGDPDFMNGPRHALAVLRALHAELPELTFDVTIKVEHLLRHAAVLPELRRLGCLFVTTAVESLSERVLAILDKRHTRHDVVAALAALRAAGLSARPTFVPFTPWGTLGEHLELLEFLAEQRLLSSVDPVQMSIRLLVPPGSLLLSHPAMAPHLGPLDPGSLTYRWTHPDPAMDLLQQRSAALCAHAAERGHSAAGTFDQLHALARAAAGLDPGRPLPLPPPAAAGRPGEEGPRLSESWFC